MIKDRIINWALRQMTAVEGTPMTESEYFSTLIRVSSVEGMDRLLKAMISSEKMRYFEISEERSDLRNQSKGAIFKLKGLREDMHNAVNELKKLEGGEKH